MDMCRRLQQLFRDESDRTLDWLCSQITGCESERHSGKAKRTSESIEDWCVDATRINAFTLLQAFFMGYYYGVFLPMVDTSSLQLQVVEGAWGFRSVRLLNIMNGIFVTNDGVVTRAVMLGVLSLFFLGVEANLPIYVDRLDDKETELDDYVGVVKKRGLFKHSVFKPCRSLDDIGHFVLLDVDMSSIPIDKDGLVRDGVPDQRQTSLLAESFLSQQSFSNISSTEDATFHIEADWEGNPERMLLCVRYKGRRIRTMSSTEADRAFQKSVEGPLSSQRAPAPVDVSERVQIISWGVTNLLAGDFPNFEREGKKNVEIRLKLPNCPRLRYYAAYLYGSYRSYMPYLSLQILSCSTASDRTRRNVWGRIGLNRGSVLVIIEGTDVVEVDI
jgi:hypothetical protein